MLEVVIRLLLHLVVYEVVVRVCLYLDDVALMNDLVSELVLDLLLLQEAVDLAEMNEFAQKETSMLVNYCHLPAAFAAFQSLQDERFKSCLVIAILLHEVNALCHRLKATMRESRHQQLFVII